MDITTSIRPKCGVCLDLDIKVLNAGRSYPFDVFNVAASNGCCVCSVILEGIEKWTEETGLAEILKGKIQKVALRVGGSHFLHVQLDSDVGDGDKKILELEFYNHRGAGSLWNKLTSTIHMPQETRWGLDTSNKWIKQQLLDCDENHPDCKSDHEKNPVLPTRVLDLGEDPENTSIRLRETNNLVGVYATLSHCWGLVHPLTTTRDTYAQRIQGIALDELPKTFRDAVLVAQSSRMAGVYSNAYVNLAASGSRDSHGSLFREGRVRYLDVQKEDESGTPYQIFVRFCLDAGHRSGLHLWVHSLSTPPLDRAWVTRNESYPEDLSEFPAGLEREILGFYTRLALTEEEDRLPALAGVAAAVQSKSNQTYYAGMWKEQMPQNLLWGYFGKGSHSKSYIAPTWSWASSRGAVHGNASPNETFYPDPRFKVLQISCEPVGRNHYGRVRTGANMKVESARLRYGTLSLETAASAQEFKIVWIYPELHMPLRNFKADHNGEGRVGGDEGGNFDYIEVNNWVFLLVGFIKARPDQAEIKAGFLVLKPSEVGPGSFVRIGVARMPMNKDLITILLQKTDLGEFCIF
ncbi:hypothetical protein V8E51_019129 [Hyaloscypha variabilis]